MDGRARPLGSERGTASAPATAGGRAIRANLRSRSASSVGNIAPGGTRRRSASRTLSSEGLGGVDAHTAVFSKKRRGGLQRRVDNQAYTASSVRRATTCATPASKYQNGAQMATGGGGITSRQAALLKRRRSGGSARRGEKTVASPLTLCRARNVFAGGLRVSMRSGRSI